MTTVPTAPAVASLPDIGDDVAIEAPTMFAPRQAGPDVHVLPAYLPVPGMGVLPANAFVLHAAEPVLVDAGPGGLAPGAFEAALGSVIDPADLRWLWLTHTDPDHIGGLAWLLEAAPQLRVVTTYLAAGKLGMISPVPLDRCWFANPGDRVDVGDRQLLALRPPSFDAPETTSVLDPVTGTLFSADAFGALMGEPAATAEDIPAQDLADGLVLWTTVDAPWIHHADRDRYLDSVRDVGRLDPARVLSSHLPPATARIGHLLDAASRVPGADPWVGPDQAALEAILAQVAG